MRSIQGMWRKTLAAIAISCAGSVPPALADPHPNTAGGVDVNQVFHVGDVDNINLFNGALTVSLPLGISYPVGGNLSYRLNLVANSNPWEFYLQSYSDRSEWQDSVPTHCSNAGLGWRVSFGAVRFGYPFFPGSAVCATTSDSTANGAYAIYEGPDGSQHLFYATLHPNASDPDDSFNGVQDSIFTGTENVVYTRDGSYLRLKRYNAGQANETTTIEFPDGAIHTFGADGRVTQMADAFVDGLGRHVNTVNISYLTAGCPPFEVPDGASQPETGCWQISDSQGRTQWIFFRSDLAPYTNTSYYGSLISRIVLTAFKGTQALYRFHYTVSSPFARGCPADDPHQPATTTAPILTSVDLPDGSYAIQAFLPALQSMHTCEPGSGSPAGLTLPTHGTLAWTYQQYFFPAPASRVYFRQNSPGVKTRTADDGRNNVGTWNYATQLNGITELVNTVTDPDGNRFVRYFSAAVSAGTSSSGWGPDQNQYDYGKPYTPLSSIQGSTVPGQSPLPVGLSEQVFDALGSLRRTEYVRVEHDQIDPYVDPANSFIDAANNNGRVAERLTVYNDDCNPGCTQGGYVDQDFDGVGHFRLRTTTGTFAGNNSHAEQHLWNPGRRSYGITPYTNTYVGSYLYVPPTAPWLFTLKQFEKRKENGVFELRTFCQDPNNGFLLRRRLYTQHTNNPNAMSATDVIAQFTPELSNPNDPQSVTGNLGGELYFGGDNSPVTPTSSDLCQQALPANPEYRIGHSFNHGTEAVSQYGGTGFYSLWHEIDASTGLVAVSRDTAGIPTSFMYDSSGRLVYIEPQDGAWTQYLFNLSNNPVLLTVQRQQNHSPGTVLAQTRYSYDGFGRLIRTDLTMADGTTSSKYTNYDALGRTASESEQGSTYYQSYLTQYLNYDPFGRAGIIRPADSATVGSAHDVTLSYNGVQSVSRTVRIGQSWNGTSVAEAPATTTETYDRLGRLASVSEPSGANGAQVTTSYGYDQSNRLTTVATTAAGTTQNRGFNYDGRGFLASETHPETASAKSYSLYDSRGHVHRTLDGVNDLSYTYDAAERPRLIYNTAYGPNCTPNPITTPTCVKQFTYDSVAAGALGRLYQASRYNHPFLGGPHTSKWTYTNTYQGPDGRLSQRTLAHVFDGQATGDQETFTQSWTYTQLGKIDTEAYPDCAAAFTRCAGTGGRAVPNAYSNGFLVAVNGYTGGAGITYHPNGMVSGVGHINGVTATYGRDPNYMARPASISVSGPSGSFWSSGSYAYDGAGNVTQIGHGYYLYDRVSRLATGQVETNAVDDPNPALDAFATQAMSYDAFGNLTTLGAIATPTSPATNQLTGGSYDAAGNLRSWNEGPPTNNVAHYDYDELNQLQHFQVGAQEWFYMYDANDERVWSYQNANPRFDRWTLRSLDGKVRRMFEVSNYVWNSWTAPNLWEDYIYRDGLLLSSSLNTLERRHMDVDHLGTMRLRTNRVGQQPSYHVYLPYGEESAATFSAADAERMKFTGHERDLADPTSDQDDLDYLHARHANPLTGRFLSPDTARGRPKAPQSWNRYAYTLGNPLRYVDPSGGDPLDVLSGFVNAVGSDVLFGSGREKPPSKDYATGQKIGDAIALIGGAYEAGQGGAVGLAAALCTAGSAGGCAPLSVPTLAVAGVAVVHGAATATIASKNLQQGISQMSSESGSSSAGNVKTLSSSRLKSLGVDAEQAKLEIAGKAAAGRFNIGVDGNGTVWLVPVEKGGSSINTGLTLSDLPRLSPK
jgi:RHS repeat-associated protein